MSTGSAIRLCQMMGLHRLDGSGLDVKQCLPPSRDWTEKEERRRTFWMAFCEDRYASIGTGWPMTVDEKDISTDLPSSEEAFEMSKPEKTQSLPESMSTCGAAKLSPFAGIVLMACLFGRNLTHLHRPDADDRDDDLNGEFWKRHRHMDNILLNTSLSLPSHLKLPNGLSSANIVFTNMNIHTSTICLHQAAIYKAEKNRLPASVSAESKVRCITAANEIASIMRMISHMDLSAMNPFISFCLYVAARVFVQYLKSRPEDSQTGDSLRFLLSAMNALKRKNPLTESFLVQLDVDLEGLGMRHPKLTSTFTIDDNNNINAKQARKFPSTFGNAMQTQPVATCTSADMDSCVTHLQMSSMDDAPPSDDAQQTQQNATGFGRGSEYRGTSNEGPANFSANFETTSWLPHGGVTTRDSYAPPAAMHGILPVEGTGRGFDVGFSYNGHMSGYGRSESSNGAAPSPDDGQSNRPTSNSTSPSDTRLQPGQSQKMNSGRTSYETSPASSHQNEKTSAPPPFYGDIGTTGLTPDFIPQTPGGREQFAVPSGWPPELGSTGLTPVGEGLFQQMMGSGPMDMGSDWPT